MDGTSALAAAAVRLVIGLPLVVFGAALPALLYLRARTEKEAYDVELLAQRTSPAS